MTLTKEGEGYKLEGTTEKEAGYNVNVTGTIVKNVLTVNVTTSGYATLSGSYGGNLLACTYNNVLLGGENFMGTASIKFTSESTMDLSLSNCVPNIFNLEEVGLIINAKGLKFQKTAEGTYAISGSVNPTGFKASTITIEGSVAEADRKLVLSVNQVIKSDIVGKWNMTKENNLGKIFFDFQSASNKVTIPDELYKLIPADMQIPQVMNDATFSTIIKNLLGQYTTYLKSIEFKPTGQVSIKYSKVGEEGKEYTIEDYMSYAIKDNGKLIITPDLGKLIGMLMPSTLSAYKSTKSYDVYDPTYILTGDGIPFNYSVSGNSLSVTVDNGVFTGLAGLVEGMLPLLGFLIPDAALVEKINATFPPIKDFIVTSPKLEVGLYLNK